MTTCIYGSLGHCSPTDPEACSPLSDHEISQEEAIEELKAYLPLLRQGSVELEREIEVVTLGEKLLYLVNFTDSRGYAVLSADRRIPERVLAIIDEGHISARDFSRKDCEDHPWHYMLHYAMEQVTHHEEGGEQGHHDLRQRVGAWHTHEEVTALLDTKWHQDYPFNDLCPKRGKYLHFFGPKAKAPAGCIALSTAQILAYHEWPTDFAYRGVVMDWKAIKSYKRHKSSEQLAQTLAALLRGVGEETIIYYGYNGSMGLPCLVRRFLQKYGYRNVETHYRDIEGRTVAMLRERKPLLMAGAGGLRGHAWLVDGFKRHRRDVDAIDPSTDHLISKRVDTETLLHCNWGWGGKADGYYTAGIFDTRKGAAAYDAKDQIHSMGRYRFDWFFSIITYDL